MQSFITLGKTIYDTSKSREARRMVVFVARCLLNRGRMAELDRYFHQTPLLADIAEIYPFVYEQPTRAFFYNKSRFDERARLVENHMGFLAGHLQPEIFRDIYREKDIELWQLQEAEEAGEKLHLTLYFEAGQRKEGCFPSCAPGEASLSDHIWIDRTSRGNGPSDRRQQGPIWTTPGIHKESPSSASDRTKNLILTRPQAVARALELRHIYAVTNYGYYANNHVRMDRKLKTSFSDFWQEAGGRSTEDSRFDELPLVEPRKTMEEVPTRKRAVYRKRFVLLDEIDETIARRMAELMKHKG